MDRARQREASLFAFQFLHPEEHGPLLRVGEPHQFLEAEIPRVVSAPDGEEEAGLVVVAIPDGHGTVRPWRDRHNEHLLLLLLVLELEEPHSDRLGYITRSESIPKPVA